MEYLRNLQGYVNIHPSAMYLPTTILVAEFECDMCMISLIFWGRHLQPTLFIPFFLDLLLNHAPNPLFFIL